MPLKFQLTNQDSAGGKNLTVLTSIKVNRNSIEIRPFISLEMALNIQEKGLIISKTKKSKTMKHFVFPSLQFGIKNQSPASRIATLWSVARWGYSCVILRKICCQIKPRILNLTIRRGQGNFSNAFIFVSFEENCVVSVG